MLTSTVIVGARSDSLGVQVDRALVTRPHVAVILIGANDITHVRPLRRQVRRLRDAVLRLREAGVEVVVGTCPDLGTTTLIRPPARTVVHRQSLRLAELQTRAALQLGAATALAVDHDQQGPVRGRLYLRAKLLDEGLLLQRRAAVLGVGGQEVDVQLQGVGPGLVDLAGELQPAARAHPG